MAKGNKYSAAASALGYLAQVDYALFLVLDRLRDIEVDASVSLETLDDIVINGDAQDAVTELWQSKQHMVSGSVGDMDPDLWKTLHNWIDLELGSSSELYLSLIHISEPTRRTPIS